MLGRELELPFSRLRPPHQLPVNTSIQARVHQHQRNMRARYDSKHHVRPTKIRVQDWVRARRPHRSNKLSSFLSEPLQVKRQLGPVTFELANGSCLHASCLRRVLCYGGKLEPTYGPHSAATKSGSWCSHRTGSENRMLSEPTIWRCPYDNSPWEDKGTSCPLPGLWSYVSYWSLVGGGKCCGC